MPKKIIDIAAPKQTAAPYSTNKPGKSFDQESEIKIKKIIRPSSQTLAEAPKKRFVKKFLVGLLIIIIALTALGGLAWLTAGFYSKLSLSIEPITEDQVFEQEVEVNIVQDQLDVENKVIPGRFFSQAENKSKTFETKSRTFVEQKAQGIIRVYNSHEPAQSISLRPTTRFLSSERGKIYQAPERINLEPASLVEGKLAPSFKDVKVLAQESGEDYNIGPSKFSVPGLAGTQFYYTVWAESLADITGGYKQETALVSQEDLTTAQDSLQADLLIQAKNSLENKLPDGFALSDDSLIVRDFHAACSAKLEDKVDQFSCNAEIEIMALCFKIDDLKKIVMNEVNRQAAAEKEIDPQSLALEFSSKNIVSQTGKMVLALTSKIKIYDKIAEDLIISRIQGKTETEIRDLIFDDFPDVKAIQFDFWPFWVRKAPKDQDRIDIKLTF